MTRKRPLTGPFVFCRRSASRREINRSNGPRDRRNCGFDGGDWVPGFAPGGAPARGYSARSTSTSMLDETPSRAVNPSHCPAPALTNKVMFFTL